MATPAACLISAGAAKSGNPCARFTAPYSIACRVISRITDSVKCETLSLRKDLFWMDKEEITSAIAGRLAQRFVILSGTLLLLHGSNVKWKDPYPVETAPSPA